MFFWFKKKKIVLDCFTNDNFAYEYCKPNWATNYYPDWYSNLSGHITLPDKVEYSIKHCTGFTELYKKSIIYPFWQVVKIDIGTIDTPGVRWNFTRATNDNDRIATHSPSQTAGFMKDSPYAHLKFPSPWRFQTNRFVQFVWHDPIWGKDELNGLRAAPAIVDYKYQYNTEVNMFIQYTDVPKTLILTPNDPLVFLTPLTEENIEIKHHMVGEKELVKWDLRVDTELANLPARTTYQHKKKFIDKHDARKASNKKCPFGFGKK